MYGSIAAVLAYLDRVDPEAAGRARYRYSCLEHFGEDTQAYGYAASLGLTDPCEEEVLDSAGGVAAAGASLHGGGRVVGEG